MPDRLGLAGAAGFEPANAGTKSRQEGRTFVKSATEPLIYPHSNINDLPHPRGRSKTSLLGDYINISRRLGIGGICGQCFADFKDVMGWNDVTAS